MYEIYPVGAHVGHILQASSTKDWAKMYKIEVTETIYENHHNNKYSLLNSSANEKWWFNI